MDASPTTIRWLGLLLVAVVTALGFVGAAHGVTGQGAPPQSAIDNASATWAAKAKLLDANGRPLFDESPPLAWIDNASATWAAKARLLGQDGRPLTVSYPQSGDVKTGAFDWADFGIGVAAMLGLVLLAGGLAVGIRTAHHPGARARPAS